jgi:hypothetical protein
VLIYKGGRFIRKGQCCANVYIFRLPVACLNATINRKTRNTEPEIGTNGFCQTPQNPWADAYGYGFGPPSRCGSGFWPVLELNRTVFPVRTRTSWGLLRPVAYIRPNISVSITLLSCWHKMCASLSWSNMTSYWTFSLSKYAYHFLHNVSEDGV